MCPDLSMKSQKLEIVKTEVLDELKQLIETNVKNTVKKKVLEDLKPLIFKVCTGSVCRLR